MQLHSLVKNLKHSNISLCCEAIGGVRAPCAGRGAQHNPSGLFSTKNDGPLPTNVFLCVAAPARYRGSGSSEPKGLAHSRKAAFQQIWQSCDVDSCRTPPPAAPPLSALYARQRRTLRSCQLRRPLNHKPSTLNPKPLPYIATPRQPQR